MKKHFFAAAMSVMLLLSGCSAAPAESVSEAPVSETEVTEKGVYALTNGYDAVSTGFEASDGWSNGSMFNCTWRKSNVVFEDTMKLVIDTDKLKTDNSPVYSGGEFRSKDFYGYGYYETEMKPIKNSGVVSSFFTYTGPSDENPWDEIDIEFLGKDTTKVQFNYFTNGKGNHEYLYDLGFDASEEFHTYGFRWAEDSITWYVDGKEVHTATESIPSTPGKIMMNVWPGTGVDSWLSPFDGTTPLQAEYRSITYKE